MNIQVINLSNPLWLQTLKKLRHDIFHLPEYLDLEARRTKTIPEAVLIVDGDKLFFLPYLLRQCNEKFDSKFMTENLFDVVSPSGYAGILLSEAAVRTPEFINLAINELTHVFRTKNVCSGFFRLHPILNNGFNEVCNTDICKVSGETVSVDLKLSEAEIWRQTKPNQRTAINKCKRAGFTARMVSFSQYIDDFVTIYEETMERVGALKAYDHDYFLHFSDVLGEKLHLCIVELNNQVVCAGLNTECCGIVQGYIGGTKTQFLNQSPFSLMLDCSRLWAKERGNEALHLGGGVGGSRDRVYAFKSGFSRQKHTFLTLRLIIDKEKYLHLVELHAKSLNVEVQNLLDADFFPAYRVLTLG